jgi:hypothetical protein
MCSEITNTAVKLFSTKDVAEKWLVKNGFVYGQHDFFKEVEVPYWFHQQDSPDDYVDVAIQKIKIDDMETRGWINEVSLRFPKLLHHLSV